PGAITGKLSDFAGLVFFPLLLAAVAEYAGIRRGMATIFAAALATAVAFTAVKTWAPAGELYRVGLAALQWPVHAVRALLSGDGAPALGRVQLVADHTDLVALVALVVPVALARRAVPSSRDEAAAAPGCAGGLRLGYSEADTGAAASAR
ncbi:MAG TPA: hypothetical protein VIV11_01915, partial [Kofleriaceae bacterium]